MSKLYFHTQALFHKGFEVFKNFLSNRPDERRAEEILKAMNHLNNNALHVFKGLVRPTSEFPTTLVHMDLWSDNLLFRVKEEDAEMPLEEADLDCTIIDWQMVSVGYALSIRYLLTLKLCGDGLFKFSRQQSN